MSSRVSIRFTPFYLDGDGFRCLDGQEIGFFYNYLLHFTGSQLVFLQSGDLPVIYIYADITVFINIAYAEADGAADPTFSEV